MKNRITASNTDYEYAYGLMRITPAAAKTMLSLKQMRLKFNSLEQMIEFLKGIKIVSNNIRFGRRPSKHKAKRTNKKMRAMFHSVRLENLDICDKLEEAGFEANEVDFAFWTIDGDSLAQAQDTYNRHRRHLNRHSKRIDCRINKRIYRFYFDIKKTFNW